MEPEPQSPGPMFLGVKETVVEWESRLSETQGRCPMGYPLPIIKDTSRTSQSLHGPPRLPAIHISHALDINFLLLLEEITTDLVFKTAQIYSVWFWRSDV